MLTIALRAFRRDLALYQDTIATFSLAPISDRFEMLRQLGNVFIVQPDILRSYLQEGYLARIENRLLRPFVMCRSDYGDYPRKFWDDVFGPDETAGTGATAGAGAGAGVGVGAGAVGAAAAQLGTQAGGAIASTLSKLPRLGNFGSGTSAFSAQMQSLRASVATKKDGSSSPTTDGRSSPVPASPRISSAPGHPPPPPPPRGGGGPPPSLPPRSAPSPILHQRPPSRSGTPDPSIPGSGSNSSISRKPSLFNSLMRDFEGLGLRDDGTGEFGTPAGGGGGGGAAGAGAGRGSVAEGSSMSKRGSLQSIRSARSVRE